MLNNLKTIIASLRRDEKGATAIEYGLIAAVVSVMILGGLQLVSGSLNAVFARIVAALG